MSFSDLIIVFVIAKINNETNNLFNLLGYICLRVD